MTQNADRPATMNEEGQLLQELYVHQHSPDRFSLDGWSQYDPVSQKNPTGFKRGQYLTLCANPQYMKKYKLSNAHYKKSVWLRRKQLSTQEINRKSHALFFMGGGLCNSSTSFRSHTCLANSKNWFSAFSLLSSPYPPPPTHTLQPSALGNKDSRKLFKSMLLPHQSKGQYLLFCVFGGSIVLPAKNTNQSWSCNSSSF